MPQLAYPDVREAAEWRCREFGFTERLRITDHRCQMNVGDGNIIVKERRTDAGPLPPGVDPDSVPPLPWRTHAIRVRVEDIEGHYARTVAAGARVIQPLQDQFYREREYTVEDISGHCWDFAETIADVDPADWGGELVGEF